MKSLTLASTIFLASAGNSIGQENVASPSGEEVSSQTKEKQLEGRQFGESAVATDSQKINNAQGLILKGIRDGDLKDAVDKYIGDRYVQHSAGVANGKDGFLQFFEPFLEQNPKRNIQIVRAIEDGRFVFLHTYRNLNNGESEWVTGNLFDTDDNDKLIEHWDVIDEDEGTNPAGRTMVDGPTEITDLDKTEANKALVQSFFDTVLLGGKFNEITNYISQEQYDQHAPGMEDGLSGLYKHIQKLRETVGIAKYHKVHRVIGQGNFVVAFSQVQKAQSHFAVFDIFRVEDGRLVEHWDVQEKILAPEKWNNSGKF